jgi:hypothetical protein
LPGDGIHHGGRGARRGLAGGTLAGLQDPYDENDYHENHGTFHKVTSIENLKHYNPGELTFMVTPRWVRVEQVAIISRYRYNKEG